MLNIKQQKNINQIEHKAEQDSENTVLPVTIELGPN